jgi:hypothetical protein
MLGRTQPRSWWSRCHLDQIHHVLHHVGYQEEREQEREENGNARTCNPPSSPLWIWWGSCAHAPPSVSIQKKCRGSHAQEWVKGSSKKIAGAAISSLSRSPLFPTLSLPDSPHVGCLGFLSNERCVTPGVSHISAIGAPTGHQISDAHP